jgi:hypothetical protein
MSLAAQFDAVAGTGLKHEMGRHRITFLSFKVFKKWLGTLFLFSLGASAQAQQGLQDTNAVAAASTNYIVADIGGNYRVWQQAVPAFTNESGQVTYRTNGYTELATGMNFLSNGQWVASSENIEITAGGGIATNGQHQVNFAANINTSNAIQITTPDGLQLNTHVMGLAYFDSATGSNVLFAELQDSTGQLVTNNQVVYPNAFTDCDADVRYMPWRCCKTARSSRGAQTRMFRPA